MANQYKFAGIDNNTTGSALSPLGSGNPLVSETYVIKSILVTSAGTPSVTVTNNSITAIKSAALTANVTTELLTQPLVVEGGDTFTVQSSTSDSFDVAISYLNIKKGGNNIMEVLKPAKVETTYRHKETGELFKERKDWEAKGYKNEDMAQDVNVIMPSLDLFGKTKQNSIMAITRAQQVRQMYKRGTGLGGNRGPQGPAGGASAGGDYGGNRSGGVSANNMSGANTSGRAGDGDGSGFSQFERRQRQNAQLQGAGFLGKDLGMNLGEQDRLAKFGDFVKSGGITGNILSSLFSGNTGTTRPPTTFVGGGGDDLQMQSIPLWAQLGFNNETEYLASLEEENNTDQETTEDDTILKRRFAAEGGIMDSDVVGGEMDFDSARQMYGLGKLVKKITRQC